nr:hypothetical protein [Burkholderia sp. NRF60-BP8]
MRFHTKRRVIAARCTNAGRGRAGPTYPPHFFRISHDGSSKSLEGDPSTVSSSETDADTFQVSAAAATIPPFQKRVEPMQKKFLMRGYEMNCEPRVTETGKYAAQVEVTKVGFSREAAFRKLGEFDTEAEAVAYARQFSEEWLSRYA